jgi:hypothetical protein
MRNVINTVNNVTVIRTNRVVAVVAGTMLPGSHPAHLSAPKGKCALSKRCPEQTRSDAADAFAGQRDCQLAYAPSCRPSDRSSSIA